MAAWSGVLFALLFTAGLILVRQAPGPAEPDADYVAFYSSGWGGVLVVLGLYIQDWRNVDYIVMSNKMRIAMERNNADGRENWIFEALDDHSEHRCGRSSEETSRSRSTAWAPTSEELVVQAVRSRGQLEDPGGGGCRDRRGRLDRPRWHRGLRR
jgi:hypothetical protein